MHTSGDVVMFAGGMVLLLVLFRALLRIPWLGNGLWLVLVISVYAAGGEGPSGTVIQALNWTMFLILLTRVGLLSALTSILVIILPWMFVVTLRPGNWYFDSSVVPMAAVVLLACWSYRSAVVGHPAFRTGDRDRRAA